MKKVFLPLVFVLLNLIAFEGIALESHKEKIKTQRSELEARKEKAHHREDKATYMIIHMVDQYLEKQSHCFEKKDKGELTTCIVKTLNDLANQGNFIAQHELGNMYENALNDPKSASKWYKEAISNTETPSIYKQEIEKDLSRLNKSKQSRS